MFIDMKSTLKLIWRVKILQNYSSPFAERMSQNESVFQFAIIYVTAYLWWLHHIAWWSFPSWDNILLSWTSCVYCILSTWSMWTGLWCTPWTTWRSINFITLTKQFYMQNIISRSFYIKSISYNESLEGHCINSLYVISCL